MFKMPLDWDLYTTPILTRPQVAALTSAPEKALKRWTAGARPAIQRPRRTTWSPYAVAFAGLLEADVLRILTEAGVPGHRATAMVRTMRADHGELALVEQPRLVTDGSHLFLRDGESLTRTHDRQGAFLNVLEEFLQRLVVQDGVVREYRPDRLPCATVAPEFNGGALSLTDSRVPVSSIAGMLKAGESASTVASEYDVPLSEVMAVADDLDWAWQAAAD